MVLNVFTRWRCQVILIVYDVRLSSIIALHSVNNNNIVYALDQLNLPFLSLVVDLVFGGVWTPARNTGNHLISRWSLFTMVTFVEQRVRPHTTATEIAEVGKKNVCPSDVIFNIPLKLIYLRNMIKNSSIFVF